MRLRVLTAADVQRALDPDQLVDALADAFAKLSAGHASMPQRIAVEVPERRAAVLLMGAHLEDRPSVTTKLVSLFPDNPPDGPPTHQAAIVVFDAATGTPAALMDGTTVTELRTAAGSRLATRLLAGPDASVLAVLGTGVQARAHASSHARERRWAELRIAGRDKAAAERLAAELPGASAADSFDAAPVEIIGSSAGRSSRMVAPMSVKRYGFSFWFACGGRSTAPAYEFDLLVQSINDCGVGHGQLQPGRYFDGS